MFLAKLFPCLCSFGEKEFRKLISSANADRGIENMERLADFGCEERNNLIC